MRPIAAHPLSDPYVRSAIVIDPDPVHSSRLASALRQQGFSALEVPDGLAGLDAVRRHPADLVVIQSALPGIDGFETVRRLRGFSDALVMLMADDDSESAVVEGFRSGADEYVVKPYGSHALRARIDALLRRSRTPVSPAAFPEDPEWLEHGPLRLHPNARRVHVHGVECELTRSEFDLLFTLMRAKDRVFSKATLALMLREANGIPGTHITPHDQHAVEVHVMNLRRKLADDPRAPQWIETVRGFGYRLAPAPVPQLSAPVLLRTTAVAG